VVQVPSPLFLLSAKGAFIGLISRESQDTPSRENFPLQPAPNPKSALKTFYAPKFLKYISSSQKTKIKKIFVKRTKSFRGNL
jgi:hypothetical protein